MKEKAKAWVTLLVVGTGFLLAVGAEGGMTQGTLTEAAGIGRMLVGAVLMSLPVAIAVVRERAANKKAAEPEQGGQDEDEKEDAA